ncbi:hypothetical protein D3C74_326470 [compost metagenome]
MLFVDLVIVIHQMLCILDALLQHLGDVLLVSFTCKSQCNVHRMIRRLRILQAFKQKLLKIDLAFVGNSKHSLIRSILASNRLYRFNIGFLRQLIYGIIQRADFKLSLLVKETVPHSNADLVRVQIFLQQQT